MSEYFYQEALMFKLIMVYNQILSTFISYFKHWAQASLNLVDNEFRTHSSYILQGKKTRIGNQENLGDL